MKVLTFIAAMIVSASALAQTEQPPAPAFTIAWSEYPSWSAFDVAQSVGLIAKNKGEMSPIEKRWGVKIVLKFMDYDPCIQLYSTGKVDAVCITNIDILSPSLGRKSVAILPTSTSYGADALIVPSDVISLEDLRGKKVYGLSKSVSEYVFYRILANNNALNFNIAFTNMDPGAAATAVQSGDKNVHSIMVWNPYVLDTLHKTQPKTHVLGDSKQSPLEVIDMVVVGDDVLRRPGGENFAKAIADVYYSLNERLNDSSTRDDTLIAIGEKFSNLGLENMRKVVDQTRFFGTPEVGISVFSNSPISIGGSPVSTLREIMNDKVVPTCIKLGMVDDKVKIGYGNSVEANKADIRFDAQYMEFVSTYHRVSPTPVSVNK